MKTIEVVEAIIVCDGEVFCAWRSIPNMRWILKDIIYIYAEGVLSEHTAISKMETVVQWGFRGNVEEIH